MLGMTDRLPLAERLETAARADPQPEAEVLVDRESGERDVVGESER